MAGRFIAAIAFSLAMATRSLIAPDELDAQCCGDCNADGEITIDEIVGAINRAFAYCPAHVVAGSWIGYHSYPGALYGVSGASASFDQSYSEEESKWIITGSIQLDPVGPCSYPPLQIRHGEMDQSGYLRFQAVAEPEHVRLIFGFRVRGNGMAGGYYTDYGSGCDGNRIAMALSR